MTSEEINLALDEIYQKYPRKLGKTPGMKKAKREIKTKLKVSQLSYAIEAYLAHCTKNRLEPKFIMHFSTFMNQWEDWLDPEHGSTNVALTASDKWSRIK